MALTTHAAKVSKSETPYQLDPEQTLKASKALLAHLRKETERLQAFASKKDLLKADADSEEDEEDQDTTPIWLTLTTKQHIVDKNRLKPAKINVPHSLNTSAELNICVISADPQRALKNVVADETFPSDISSRIARIIGISKLKARYKSFEQKRALRDEHDVFLADDRIVTRLPDLLGKPFYKSTTKRPIPIRIAEQSRVDGKRVKREKTKTKPEEDKSATVASPFVVGKEISRALQAVPVHLKPGTSVAIRVGLTSFTPEQLVDNIAVVAAAVIEKHVVKGWRNIRSIHIKSPTSTALPIWLADELWTETTDVYNEGEVEVVTDSPTSKRKRDPESVKGPQAGQRKKAKVLSSDATAEHSRKQRLASEKAKAFSNAAKAVMA
jgi:ribosome biogenesis protein UTP30